MRGLVVVFMVMAGAAMAQDSEMPVLDASLLDTCLDNASLRAGQEEERDAESCIGVAAGQCMEGEDGSSSSGKYHCFLQEEKLWDTRLNDAYAATMAKAEAMDRMNAEADPSAPGQAAALKRMQRDWIRFRDSSCAYERSLWGNGNGAPAASAYCGMSMTASQALRLERHNGL